jgi:transcription elongation GreA/GreB family factor
MYRGESQQITHEVSDERNSYIMRLLQDGMLPVLRFEMDAIEQQLSRVMDEQNERGKELQEVNHQSSETWHDNHAANEIARYSRVISARGERLVANREKAVQIDYPGDGERVTLGSLIELVFGESNESTPALLTGVSTQVDPTISELLPEDTICVTLQSPVGGALLNALPGERVFYEVEGRPKEVKVLSARPLSLVN